MKCPSTSSNATNAEICTSHFVSVQTVKTEAPALPAVRRTAKNNFRFFHPVVPVRALVWGAHHRQGPAAPVAAFPERVDGAAVC